MEPTIQPPRATLQLVAQNGLSTLPRRKQPAMFIDRNTRIASRLASATVNRGRKKSTVFQNQATTSSQFVRSHFTHRATSTRPCKFRTPDIGPLQAHDLRALPRRVIRTKAWPAFSDLLTEH